MAQEIQVQETYIMNADGSLKEVITKEITVDVKTNAEIILEKEAELLSMYKELEALKLN